MSLAEITRNCFQSGISSGKWLSLCKLFISKNPIIVGPETVANHISNSILVLYRSYPGNPGLTAYFNRAIKDGIVPLAILVSTFLQAARSPDFHQPPTLDVICELILKTHETSATSPVGSLVPFSESQVTILETVQDALALVKVSQEGVNGQSPPYHQNLFKNAQKLLVDLISCVSDVSQVTVGQAFLQYSFVNEILQGCQIDPQVRPVLESFAINLGMLIGDDAKVAREAQMLQTMQMAKGDIGGPNSDSDVITLGLLWQYLVNHRAHEFGAGNTPCVVMLLVSTWRWSSWTAPVFFTQAFLSAFTCLASNTGNVLFWKAFIIGRLPHLLAEFHNFMSTDCGHLRDSLQQGLRHAFRRPDVIVTGDHLLIQASGLNNTSDGNMHSYTRELLQELVKVELIDQNLAIELDPSIANDTSHNLHTEAHDAGVELATFLEMRLTPEMDITDARLWLDRIWKDVPSHDIFATFIMKRFSSLSTALDVELLSHLCKLLFTHETALDLVAMHVKISDLVFKALLFLEEYDCESVGDPQTSVSHLGDVVLFVQYTLMRFQFDQTIFTKDGRSISVDFLQHTDEILQLDSLPVAEAASFHSWFKALFDSSSEGIEDTILRSTHPKILLRISATLFSQAIKVASMHKIDMDVLMNGVSYFTGPLLNWTLVGVIKALMKEVQRSKNPAPTYFEILQILLMSPSCPRPVLALCSPSVLRYLSDRATPGISSCPSFNVTAVQGVVTEAAVRGANSFNSYPATSWRQYPREVLHAAMTLGPSQKIVNLDVDRCLKMINPTRFLQILWPELAVAASMGELEMCRRLSTYILSMPRNSKVPPLLPIFMHLVLPSLISYIDSQAAQEQTSNVELLTTIIFSSLTAALHLEWSMSTVLGDNRMILGASSSAIARRLANDLRFKKKSQTSSLILQRLSSSQSFVANFPYFGGELGS